MPTHPVSFTVTFSQATLGLTTTDTFDVDWQVDCSPTVVILDPISDILVLVSDPAGAVQTPLSPTNSVAVT